MLLKSYGIGEQFIAFKQGNHQLIQIDKQLIQNNKPIIKLSETLISAIYHKDNWIVATDNQIIWIDSNGQIIQSMDEFDGLKLPISNVGLFNQELIYNSEGENYNIDSEKVKTNSHTAIQWAELDTDISIKQKAIELTSKNYLTFEQFIFDIHAAITTPSLLNDIAAISLIILSLSGIFLFFRKKKRNRQ